MLFVRDNVLRAQRFDLDRLEVSGEAFRAADDQIAVDPVCRPRSFSVSDNGVLAYHPSTGETRLAWMDRTGEPLGVIGPIGNYGAPELSTDEKRLIVPLYSDGYSISLMALSDDWGAHWTTSEPLVGWGNIQPSLARKKDGTLVAYMRDNGPPPKRLMKSESKDRGMTWSEVVDTELFNPGSGAEVLVLSHYEGETALRDEAAAVDGLLRGSLRDLLKSGEFQGKSGQAVLLHTQGKIPAKRILLVGLGKKKDARLDTVRQAMGIAAKRVRQAGAKSFSTPVHGRSLAGLSVSESVQAMV